MFGKRLQELTPQDIQLIIAAGEPEGSEVEYKRTLQDGGKTPDPWLVNQSAIGEKARNGLVAEVIAFANSYGGTLIIGIVESDDAPHRAAGVNPLPKCHDLAERLRYQIRDCVEPPIPIIEAAGVTIGDGDAGVVVIRVQPSRNAPHRHRQTRECYMRRADRTEKMTMREIQDLTLHTHTGMARVEAEFDSRHAALERVCEESPSAVITGASVVLIPLAPMFLRDVSRNPSVTLPSSDVIIQIGDDQFRGHCPLHGGYPRAILRGIQSKEAWERGQSSRVLKCDGIIEYQYVQNYHPHGPRLYPSHILTTVANSLVAVDGFRRACGSPGAEYGMDIAVFTTAQPALLPGYGSSPEHYTIGWIDVGYHRFPRYSVGPSDEFRGLVSEVERDLCNLAGNDTDGPAVTVDFARFNRLS